jgi:hypothetical protein
VSLKLMVGFVEGFLGHFGGGLEEKLGKSEEI